jgi:hypothetical protein
MSPRKTVLWLATTFQRARDSLLILQKSIETHMFGLIQMNFGQKDSLQPIMVLMLGASISNCYHLVPAEEGARELH